MSLLVADANAKVNLALAVTATRDDGYHELRSVFLRLALHDRLPSLERNSGSVALLPCDRDSVIADPLLTVGPEGRAAFGPASPADARGIKALDASNAGMRPR